MKLWWCVFLNLPQAKLEEIQKIGSESLKWISWSLEDLEGHTRLQWQFLSLYYTYGQNADYSVIFISVYMWQKGGSYFFFFNLFIYGCVGSSFLRKGFL